MLISFKVLILRAAMDLQMSLNSSSGHTANGKVSFYGVLLVLCFVSHQSHFAMRTVKEGKEKF
jgi:hypothetical protein